MNPSSSNACVCGRSIPVECPLGRGILINRIASLGSRLVSMRSMIVELTNRCKGKQVGRKTPKAIVDQRARDVAHLAALQAELPRVEGTFFGLRFREREIDHG